MMAAKPLPLSRTRGFLSLTATALVTTLAAALLVTGFAGTAHAEDGYRFWNYFHLENGEWAFSQVGPSDYKQLQDGDVEAYRFGTSGASDTNGVAPRADLAEVNFDSICGAEEAPAGSKRIAVVVDYGTEADAEGTTPPEPRTECAVVPENANGQQVLDQVATVRSQSGLTCALDGYPAKGCGEPVSDVQPADEQPVTFQLPGSAADDTAAADEDSGLLWPLVGIGALLVVIAGAALALGRRNRTA